MTVERDELERRLRDVLANKKLELNQNERKHFNEIFDWLTNSGNEKAFCVSLHSDQHKILLILNEFNLEDFDQSQMIKINELKNFLVKVTTKLNGMKARVEKKKKSF